MLKETLRRVLATDDIQLGLAGEQDRAKMYFNIFGTGDCMQEVALANKHKVEAGSLMEEGVTIEAEVTRLLDKVQGLLRG